MKKAKQINGCNVRDYDNPAEAISDLVELMVDYMDKFEKDESRISDLTFGMDCRGDHAFFIEARHLEGWTIDQEACNALIDEFDPVFFRKIQNGVETHVHGWIEGNEIVQFG